MGSAKRDRWWVAKSSQPAAAGSFSSSGGKLVASDGPYAEAKDVIGGYFLIEARDLAAAEAIARECPHFALASSNWAEVRPIEDMKQVRAAAG